MQLMRRISTQKQQHSKTPDRKLENMNCANNAATVTWIGTIAFEINGEHHHVFRVRDLAGKFVEVIVAAEVADDPRALRRALISKGARLPATKEDSDRLLRGIINGPPSVYWKVPRQPGWVTPNAFMIGNRVIGTPEAQYRLPPDHPAGNWFSQAGTLEGWQAKVAKPAEYSALLMTIICVPLAATVKHVVQMPNFMIGIPGPSKSGKSTTIVVAASVFGIGTEQGLPNFNATNISIQEVAQAFESLMLPMNELGLITGPKAKTYDTFIRPLIFAYAEGSPRRRSEWSTAPTKSKGEPWHGILVYTSEDTLAELALLGNAKRYAGERARCHEIPATGGRRSTVIDRWPSSVPPSGRKAWAREQLGRLRAACQQEHGTAVDAFVTDVINRGSRATRTFLEARMKEFLTLLRPAALPPEVAHAARNFALLYAAGALAIKAGVLPWRRDRLRRAISKSFRAAYPEAVDVLAVAKGQLRRCLAAATIHTRPKGEETTPNAKCAGYIDEDGYHRIAATTFKGWFIQPQFEAILGHLAAKKCLKLPRKMGRSNHVSGISRADCTVKWPDGKIHRTIIFKVPRNLGKRRNRK